MATHSHLSRHPQDVRPADVEAFRKAIRPLVGPLRDTLDDLLRSLCSAAETGKDVVVDIGSQCNHNPSRPSTGVPGFPSTGYRA